MLSITDDENVDISIEEEKEILHMRKDAKKKMKVARIKVFSPFISLLFTEVVFAEMLD